MTMMKMTIEMIIKNDNNDLKLLKARLGLDVQLLLDLVSHSGGILGHLAPIHLFHFTNDYHVLDVYDNTDADEDAAAVSRTTAPSRHNMLPLPDAAMRTMRPVVHFPYSV